MKRWWRVIIIVPIVSALTLLFAYKFAYAFLTWESLPVKINSSLAIKIVAILSSILIPYLNWRIYKINYWISLSFWILATIAALISIPQNPEGNPNLALVGHFISHQLVAIILTMLLTAVIVRKKSRSVNSQVSGQS
jgi:hypothetical protein